MGQIVLQPWEMPAGNVAQEQDLASSCSSGGQTTSTNIWQAMPNSPVLSPWIFWAATQQQSPVITKQTPLAALLFPMELSL